MPDEPLNDSSRYAIDRELGRGGMGRVFSARDLRLGRPVAIKILPESLAADPAGVARLQREARALAKVSHPNIAAIYSLEVTRRGSRLLILEHVEGETLAKLLRRGPLPIPEALHICGQIAAALEAAHERGVIHRDLKPANIMVTPDRRVKILDFGLAKITRLEGELDHAEELDTTQPGRTLGTPGYMSPEQIQGIAADSRSDVFAFGCVLYECLTGSKAFSGDEIGAAATVLMRDPSWTALPRGTPGEIKDLLRHCLRKNRDERLRDIAEARAMIEAWCGTSPDRSRLASLGSSHHNLPEPLTSFVGRELELAVAAALLVEHRMVTLTGPGGAGKTRLALRLAETRLSEHPDGVWLVELAPLADPERLPATVAAALGAHERAGSWIVDTLTEHLAERSLLLVLDNCEHLLPACSGLARSLLAGAPGLRILATSREPLRVPGEKVYPVPALGTVYRSRWARGGAEPGGLSEAARLFFDRAASIRPDLDPMGRDVEAVEEICRHLEGLPLAVELAAARVRVLSPQEILVRLTDQLRLLTGGGSELEPRHQTLAATIGWSYDLLTPEERRFFRALAVFSGGWTLQSAAEIVGGERDEFEILDLLSRLVDKSLVLVAPEIQQQLRFRMLDTVRQFALERLRDSAEESEIRSRHFKHYHRLALEAAPGLIGPEHVVWLDRLDSEHENFLTALWWSREMEGGDRKALRIAAALWRFWFGQGQFEIGRTLLESLLARPGGAARTAERVEALLGAGALAFHQNDFPAGIRRYEESVSIARELNDAPGIAFSLGGLGNIHLGRGSYAEARASYEEALSLFRDAGHRRGVGLTLSNLGRLAELEGDFPRAHELASEGIEVFREVGDVASLALRLSSLGELSLRLGRRDAARALLLECLRVNQELEEPHPAAYALERTASLLAAAGEARVATRLCSAAATVRDRITSPRSPKEKQELDQLLLGLQRALGGTHFGQTWNEARWLPLEKAVAEAMRALEGVPATTAE